MSTTDLEIAAGFGECAVCFEPLCARGVSVMMDGTRQKGCCWGCLPDKLPKRTCAHFLCEECAPTIEPYNCPVCRRKFAALCKVPDPLVNPMQWFQIVDGGQDGLIEKSEMVNALKGMFAVQPEALEKELANMWDSWDDAEKGALDIGNFCDLVVPFLVEKLEHLPERNITQDIPDIETLPLEWFKLWDEDKSGTLERPEIVRGLIKSIPEWSGRQESWLVETLAGIWSLIDPNGDGSITEAEFIMPEGLHETLMAEV